MRFDEVLRTWSEWFEKEGIRYAVAGGLAVHAWGHSRPTYDADFATDGAQQGRVIAFAESLGYQTVYASKGYSNHHHAQEVFGYVDVLYLYGPTADAVFSAATRRVVVGLSCPVVQPEHLIAMKVQAIKNAPRRVPIDVPDIEFLLSLPDTNRAAVRDLFDREGLLPIFNVISKPR